MALNLGELVAYLRVDDTMFRSTLATAPATAGVAGASMGNSLGGSFLSTAKRFVAPLAATFGTMAIGNFIKDSVDAASTAAESANAISVAFGDAADGVMKLSSTSVDRLNMNGNAFREYAVRFSGFADDIVGQGGDVTGFIDDLTTRGADFASVYNIDAAEALQVFQSGLAGETEPLKKFGINLSEAAIQAYAVSSGIIKSGETMTDAEKAQARYGLLMEETAKVQGDLANTADSHANKQRHMNEKFAEAQAVIGEAFIPILDAAITFITDSVIPAMEDGGEAIKGFFTWFGDNQGWLLPLLSGIGAILLSIGIYTTALGIAAAITAAGGLPAIIAATWAWTAALLANPVTWIILGIGLLVAALVWLFMNWDAVTKWVTAAWNGAVKWLSDSFKNLGKWWGDMWNGMLTGLGNFWKDISNWFSNLPKMIADFFAGAGKWLWDAGRNIVQGLLDGLKSLGSTIGKFFLSLLPSWIVEPFKAALGIHSPSRVFESYGKNTMEGYIRGVSGMKGSIASVISGSVTAPSVSSAVSGMSRSAGVGSTINYYAAENQSLSAEEALFAALSSPRVRVA